MHPKIVNREVVDNCVINSSWLQIEITLDRYSNKTVEDTIKKAIEQAKNDGVGKVEVLLKQPLLKKYQKTVLSCGLKPGLAGLTIKIAEFKKSNIHFKEQSPQILVNKANINSLKELLVQQSQYHHQSQPDYYLSPDEIDWQSYNKQLGTEQLNQNCIQLVAMINNNPVGLLFAEKSDNNPQVIFITELIVDRQHRSRGIGSQLIKKLINENCNQYTIIELETLPKIPAYSWYKTLGFEDDGSFYYWTNQPTYQDQVTLVFA